MESLKPETLVLLVNSDFNLVNANQNILVQIVKNSEKIKQKEAKVIASPVRSGYGLNLVGEKDELSKVFKEMEQNKMSFEEFFEKKRQHLLVDYNKDFFAPIENMDAGLIQSKSMTFCKQMF